ncbi:sigma-70 family RNA polymerase sigma factor [Alloalcanivorax gelatiniphagus]
MSAPTLTRASLIEGEAASAAGAELDVALEAFLAMRTRLFRIAYRVTGDITGADDVVQDAWLRWQRTDRTCIENPAAFLTTTTTHLAINVIQSARHRRETPTEAPPIQLDESISDPTTRAEENSSVEQSLRLLMSKLSRSELAAYVLRKGFDYPYVRIAELVHTSTPNARQLVRRAQRRIEGDRDRYVPPEEHRALVKAFLVGMRTGELHELERLLVGGQPVPATGAAAQIVRSETAPCATPVSRAA